MTVDRDRLEFLAQDAVQGFTAHCGLTPVLMEPGRFVTRITLQEHHHQQDGFAHAGLIATMADHTAGYASYSLVPPDRRILSVEYKINFLAPGVGDYLECTAQVIKPGKRLLVVEADVVAVSNGEAKPVAKALLTMAAVPRERVGKSRDSAGR